MASKNGESDNEMANPIAGPSNPAKGSTSTVTSAAATASNQFGAFSIPDEFCSPEFNDDITPSQPPPQGNSFFCLAFVLFLYLYDLFNSFIVHDDSDSSSDDDVASGKKAKKEKKSLEKQLKDKARSYGNSITAAQLKLTAAKRKAKGPIIVAAHHEAKVLKEIKTSTNANMNKTLRAPKSTQEAAHETNNLTQFAIANMEMTEFNQRSQTDRDTVASINNFADFM